MTNATPRADFLQKLAAMDNLHLGPCGGRVRLRRWVNMLVTPTRFRGHHRAGWRTFQFLWRTFQFLACLIGGYGALLCEEHLSKPSAVLHADRRAGLDLRMAKAGDESTWKIASFWAWPTGRGQGLEVIAAVIAAADATGTTLLLSAANRRLAARYYAPLGFVVRSGQETARRPRMERLPGAVHAGTESIMHAGVA